jgi:hypothetical protein
MLVSMSAGLLDQTHPDLMLFGEVFEGLPSFVAFQAPHDLGGVESSFSSACHRGTGLLMAEHAGEHDGKEGGVGVAVASRCSGLSPGRQFVVCLGSKGVVKVEVFHGNSRTSHRRRAFGTQAVH